MAFLADIHCQGAMWWKTVSPWWKMVTSVLRTGWSEVTFFETPSHHGWGISSWWTWRWEERLECARSLEAAAAAEEEEARISTGTEKLQREAFGAKSWLGAELGSWRQRSLSGPLIPGGKRALTASHGRSGPHHPGPASREAFLFPPAKQGKKGLQRENKKC